MRTENFYKIVIVLLLLINAGTLGYLLLPSQKKDAENRPERMGPPRHDRIIIERLELNESQISNFETLKREHHSQMVDIQRESGKLHKTLFELLKNDKVDESAKDSLLTLIQHTNLQKEEVTFEHFQKLRSILNEKQKDEFDDLVADMSERIMGPHRPAQKIR